MSANPRMMHKKIMGALIAFAVCFALCCVVAAAVTQQLYENGILQVSVTDEAFDLRIFDDTTGDYTISTTAGDSGFGIHVRNSADRASDGATALTAPTYSFATDSISDAALDQAVDLDVAFDFSIDGEYLQVSYTLTNQSESTQTIDFGFSGTLAGLADGSAVLSRVSAGIQTVDDAAERQFTLAFRQIAGVDATNVWFGAYSKPSDYYYTGSTEQDLFLTSAVGNTAVLSVAWWDQTLAVGERQTYVVIFNMQDSTDASDDDADFTALLTARAELAIVPSSYPDTVQSAVRAILQQVIAEIAAATSPETAASVLAAAIDAAEALREQPSITPSPTATATPVATAAPVATATVTPVASAEITVTTLPTVTATATPVASASPTPSATPEATPAPTASPTQAPAQETDAPAETFTVSGSVAASVAEQAVETLLDSLFTETEKATRQDRKIILHVAEVAEVAPALTEQLETFLQGYSGDVTTAQVYDISIEKILGASSEYITQLGDAILITLPIDPSLQQEGRVFYLVREHEGVLTLLEDQDQALDSISVNSDLFSTYWLVYSNAPISAVIQQPTNHNTALLLGMTVVLVIIVVVVVKRRRDDAKHQDDDDWDGTL